MNHTMTLLRNKSLLFFLLLSTLSYSQTKYWIFLKDKNVEDAPALSAKSIQHRVQQKLPIFDETDLPIHQDYYTQLNARYPILNKSRWLNAVSASLTSTQLTEVLSLPFVAKVQPIDGRFYIAQSTQSRRTTLAPVMTQIQSDAFKKAGLTAKGVTIGVIDAGFLEAPANDLLKHIFDKKAILDKRDYVNPALATADKFYSTPETFSDFHGTEVMSAIAGINYSQNKQHGLATDAQFYLARTDHGAQEWRGEEDNWVAAMEWMDSLGVRLINTSLGYAQGFTDPNENYQPTQMDGKTSVISRAAQIATDKKGILLIVSAGNEGDDPSWRIISTPADAQGVLAVGATNQRHWNKIGYSSIGPEFLPYLKPNVSCFSLYGTSLSAPVITGFAACLMQANPTLTNKELINIIEKSAHLYPYGNNYIGYGVPLATRALTLLQNPSESSSIYAREVVATGDSYTLKFRDTGDMVSSLYLKIPEPTDMISVFHKKNTIHVLTQELVKVKDSQIVLKRREGETHTTVDLKDEVVEVIWER